MIFGVLDSFSSKPIELVEDLYKKIMGLAKNTQANNQNEQDNADTLAEMLEEALNPENSDATEATEEATEAAEEYSEQIEENAEAVQEYAAEQEEMTEGSGRATKAFNILKGAAKMLAKAFVISAVSSLITDFMSSVETMEDVAEAADEVKGSVGDLKENMSENKDTISGLNDRYQELSKGVSETGHSISLSNEDYNEYKDIISQISDIMPNLSVRYNENGEKIGFMAGQLKDLNEQYNTYLENTAKELLYGNGSDDPTLTDVVKNVNSSIENSRGFSSEQVTASLEELITFGNADSSDIVLSPKQIISALKQLRNLEFADENAINDYIKEQNIWNSTDFKREYRANHNGYLTAADYIDGYTDQGIVLEDILGLDGDEISEMSKEEFEDFRESLGGYIDKYQGKIDAAYQEIIDFLPTIAMSNGSDNGWNDLGDEQEYLNSMFAGLSSDALENIGVIDEDSRVNEGKLIKYVDKITKLYADDPRLQELSKKLFTIDFNTDEASGYISADIKEAVSEIQKIFEENEINLSKLNIQDMFGFTDYYEKNVDSNIEKIKSYFAEESQEAISSSIGGLSFKELKLAGEMDIPEGTLSSWDELITKMETANKFTTISPEEEFKKVFASETYVDISNELIELAKAGNISPEVLTSTEEYNKLLEQTGATAEEATSNIIKMCGELDYADLMEGLSGSVGTLINAEKELEENGVISFSTVQSLLEVYPDLENSLIATSEGYKLTEGAIEDTIDAQISHYELVYNESLDAATKLMDAQFGVSLSYASTTEEIKKSMEAKIADLKVTQGVLAAQQAVLIQTGGLANSVIAGMTAATSATINSQVGLLTKYLEDLETSQSNLNNYKEIIEQLRIDNKNSNSGSSSSSDQTFDWIETKISRLTDSLEKAKTSMNNVYSSWESRNKSLASAINTTTQAINLQKQAANAYLREANEVGLSQTYKNLVQNGALDISTITDGNLSEKINEYKDYYEKYLEANKQVIELETSLKELKYNEQIENIQKQFDDKDAIEIEANVTLSQSDIDMAEAKGLFANEQSYNNLIALSEKRISNLIAERSQLQSILSSMSTSEIGSEGYNEIYQTIIGINEELNEAELQTIEYQNSLRALDWEIFDYIEDSISRICSETEFLADLMSDKDLFDENGKRTEYGDATIAVHNIAYETYKKQAQDYYDEMADLEKQLNEGNKDVLERYNEVVDAHRDAILAAQDEKNAILELVEEGYQSQLDALQDIIDKKKEAMNAEKDLYDYQKSIEEKSNTVSTLEKQILSTKDDNSEEAQSKIQQWQVELEDAREDLEQTQYDKYLSDQEQMLDLLASEYELWMNERLDNEEYLLEQIVTEISSKGETIQTTLDSVASEYGTKIGESINIALNDDFSGISVAINNVATSINNLISTISTKPYTSTQSSSASSNVQISNPVKTTNTSSTSSTSGSGKSSSLDSILIDKVDNYPKNKLKINTSVVDRLKYNNKDSSWAARSKYWSKIFGGTYTGSSAQNTKLLNYLKSNGYKSGTSSAIKGLHWTQEDGEEIIVRKSDGAILTPLGEGDTVFNSEMTKNLWELAKMPSLLSLAKANTNAPILNKMSNENNINNNVNITLSLPNVSDYNDFINNMQSDKRFEKIIESITIDKLSGKNSLNKYKF